MAPKGLLIILSGPSGVGKGTIGKRLLEGDPNMRFSVSVTTRAPREGERDGVDYHFITEDAFNRLVEEDLLLEHACVHEHFYGTPREPIDKMLRLGHDIILDIDPQGGRQVLEKCPDCVSIFLLPPSWKQLHARLSGRNTETAEQIAVRMRNARQEVAQAGFYTYAVVNQDGEEGIRLAYEQILHILESERLKTSRQVPDVPEE